MKIKKWNENELGQLTLDNIRILFPSENGFIVRWNKYNEGDEFSGWSKSVTKYILSGSCEIKINGGNFLLHANNFIKIPEGKYHFKVIDNDVVEYIMVFKLPEIN